MSGRKPTLGYPSRTEAVLALRGKGLDTSEIAESIGIEIKTVVALECSAARSARRHKRPSEQQGRTIVFPVDVLGSLRPHAQARGITVNKMVRDIVAAVADDELVDAILDDTDGRAPADQTIPDAREIGASRS